MVNLSISNALPAEARPLNCYKVSLIFSMFRNSPPVTADVYIPKEHEADLKQFIGDLEEYYDTALDWNDWVGTPLEKYVGKEMDPYKWNDYNGISFEWPYIEDETCHYEKYDVTFFLVTGPECNVTVEVTNED